MKDKNTMKTKIIMLIMLLTNISIQCSDHEESKTKPKIPGLNIHQAADMQLATLDGSKRAQLQAMIDRGKWERIAKQLPQDLREKYTEYREATTVHSPREIKPTKENKK